MKSFLTSAIMLSLLANAVAEGVRHQLSDDLNSSDIQLVQAQGDGNAAPENSGDTANPGRTANPGGSGDTGNAAGGDRAPATDRNPADRNQPDRNQNPNNQNNRNQSNRPQSNPYARISRVPNMFGDSLPPTTTSFFRACDNVVQSSVITEALTAGGSRYTPIGENNRPLPTDRIYFLYNGFQNVVTTSDLIAGRTFDSNLHRYTLGFEKTFNDQQSSVELRVPFTSQIQLEIGDYSSETSDMGNLMLVTKHLLLETDDTAIAWGLGIGTPTADDFVANTGLAQVRLKNESVYLLPYIGWAKTVNENWFSTVYMQLEIPTHGDTFTVDTLGDLGKLNTSTFARIDVSVGRWLLQDLDRPYLDGVAAVFEFHYLTTLNDNDQILANDGLNSFAVADVENRVDYLNITAGAHFQLTELSNFRVAGVFPIRNDPDRQFDSELQVVFNRNF
jgi:hypothetical protein